MQRGGCRAHSGNAGLLKGRHGADQAARDADRHGQRQAPASHQTRERRTLQALGQHAGVLTDLDHVEHAPDRRVLRPHQRTRATDRVIRQRLPRDLKHALSVRLPVYDGVHIRCGVIREHCLNDQASGDRLSYAQCAHALPPTPSSGRCRAAIIPRSSERLPLPRPREQVLGERHCDHLRGLEVPRHELAVGERRVDELDDPVGVARVVTDRDSQRARP